MEIGPITPASPLTATSTAGYDTAASLPPEQVAKEREMIKAVKALNGTELFGHESELTFVFDRETRRALVRVVNRQTREVVMQIPPEYVIRMAEENQRSW